MKKLGPSCKAVTFRCNGPVKSIFYPEACNFRPKRLIVWGDRSGGTVQFAVGKWQSAKYAISPQPQELEMGELANWPALGSGIPVEVHQRGEHVVVEGVLVGERMTGSEG